MSGETENYSSATLLRLLLIRTISISLYLTAYRNIEAITRFLLRVSKHHIILSLLLSHVKVLLNPKRLFPKTFVLIILFSTTLMPIIRDLLKGIATNTVFLWFFILQVVFCIDTIRVSILNKGQPRKVFNRNEAISLEESMLITKKIESNGIIGNISILLGFFGTLSRVKDDIEVLILLAIGFITYHFVLRTLENCLVHIYTSRLLIIILVLFGIQYIFDEQQFQIFLLFFPVTSFLWILSAKLIERNITRRDNK